MAGGDSWPRADPDDPFEQKRLWRRRKEVQAVLESAKRPSEVLIAVEEARGGAGGALPLTKWDGVNLSTAIHRVVRLLVKDSHDKPTKQMNAVKRDPRYATLMEEIANRGRDFDSEAQDMIAWATKKLGEQDGIGKVALNSRRKAHRLSRDLSQAKGPEDALRLVKVDEEALNDATIAKAIHIMAIGDRSPESRRALVTTDGFEWLLSQTKRRAHFFRPGTITLAFLSLGRLDVLRRCREGAGASEAVDALLDRLGKIAVQLEPSHFPTALASIACLRADCRCKTLRAIVDASGEQLREMSEEELTRLARGLAQINGAYNPGSSYLHHLLAAFVRRGDFRLSDARELSHALWHLDYVPSEHLLDKLLDGLVRSCPEGGHDPRDLSRVVFSIGRIGYSAPAEALASLFSPLETTLERLSGPQAVAVAGALGVHRASGYNDPRRCIHVERDFQARLRDALLRDCKSIRSKSDLSMLPDALALLQDVLGPKQLEELARTTLPVALDVGGPRLRKELKHRFEVLGAGTALVRHLLSPFEREASSSGERGDPSSSAQLAVGTLT